MKALNSSFAGYLLVAVSAITFSAKGIFAKVLYSYGLDPLTLLALRFLLTLPFFWGLMFIYPSERIGLKDLLILILSGLIGFYLAALADFYGLLYIDATLERVVLYTYPTIVVILATLFLQEKMNGRKILALMITYSGLLLACKVFNGNFNSHLWGVALVFFSAVVYAVSYLITEVLGKRVSSVKITTYSATAATFAFVGTWHGAYVPDNLEVWGIIFIMAFASTFIPFITLTIGIKRIGASRAAIVSSIGPVSTAMLAYVILGEQMDLIQVIGMGLVLTGVLIISAKGKGVLETDKDLS